MHLRCTGTTAQQQVTTQQAPERRRQPDTRHTAPRRGRTGQTAGRDTGGKVVGERQGVSPPSSPAFHSVVPHSVVGQLGVFLEKPRT